MYARVTDRVQTGITDGRFGDGQQMASFTRTYAINDILAETEPDILRDLGRVFGWTQLAAHLVALTDREVARGRRSPFGRPSATRSPRLTAPRTAGGVESPTTGQ
jgi:hypothetical protein